MRKLFLHIGFAKCGSTSLQAAMSEAAGIVFPKSGNHGGEHLSLALTLRGIDDWTRQYFDESWVDHGMAGTMAEIKSSTETVVLSSERLAAMTEDQIAAVKAMFPDFDIQVILIRRDVQRYLSSTWRHAVFRHDLGENYEVFLERFKTFDFGDVGTKFSKRFPVHSFDMEAPDYATSLGALIGTTVEIPRANVGVPLELAQLLQRTHVLLGTEEFKKRFDRDTKEAMLAVWTGHATARIEPIDAKLF
jgi:hypothetical protein